MGREQPRSLTDEGLGTVPIFTSQSCWQGLTDVQKASLPSQSWLSGQEGQVKDDVIQDVLSVYLGNFQRVFPLILPYNMAKCCNTSIEIWSHES